MQLFKSCSHDVLVLRRGPSQHSQIVSDKLEVLEVTDSLCISVFFFLESTNKFSEFFALHDSVSILAWLKVPLQDACLLGDSNCGFLVVTCYHADDHSCPVAKLHCVGDLVTQRVLNADHANNHKVLLNLFGR